MNQVTMQIIEKSAARNQYIRDMKWVGRHIARQATYKKEDIIIVVIPLKEWHEIVGKYPIYHEMKEPTNAV